MKKLFYLFLIIFSAKSLNAQSNYFTLTTEKLQALKTQAVNDADYEKAANLKKEIAEREKESQTITELEAELDNKVKAEDFEGATALKTQLNNSKEKKQKKDQLRLEIEQALAVEDYEKTALLKKELLSLNEEENEPLLNETPQREKAPVVVETPTVAPPAPQKVEPPAVNAAFSPASAKDTRKKTFIAYSPGSYAPYGVLMGQLAQQGCELIGSWRFTNNIFLDTKDQKIEDGVINDDQYTWKYSGIGYHSYQGFNLGLSIRMFGDVNRVSGYFLPAIGIGRYRYMYDYTKTRGSSTTTTVLDSDKSGYNFTLAPVFLVNFKFINIHLGTEIGIPRVNQSNFVFGLGGAF